MTRCRGERSLAVTGLLLGEDGHRQVAAIGAGRRRVNEVLWELSGSRLDRQIAIKSLTCTDGAPSGT